MIRRGKVGCAETVGRKNRVCCSYRVDTCACVESVGPACTRVQSVDLLKTLAFMSTCRLDPVYGNYSLFSFFFVIGSFYIFFIIKLYGKLAGYIFFLAKKAKKSES